MIKELQLRILPEEAVNEQSLRQVVARETGEAPKNIRAVRVLKRSIDARQRTIFVNVKLRVFMNEMPSEPEYQSIEYKDVSAGKPVIVVGAGPGGLFAALRLIELGLRPIIVERGKDVRERKKDIALISREHKVNGESNYSFGEGGAGAYSDGKLYTRSKKRGSVDKILNIFCQFGASPSILADAHPHIGTDKLPRVIENIREQIKRCGGEVHFETRMDAFIMKENEVIGIETNTGKSFYGPVILATGHSARDVYNYLYERQIQIEAKGIAVGVRLEHSQELIDQIQYHRKEGRGKYLPAAEYSFVTQANNRGVYSFCMCPGGFVVNASSEPERLTVNGMSNHDRAAKNSNSAIIASVTPEDFDGNDALAGVRFQQKWEEKAFSEGKGRIPVQTLKDFREGKITESFGEITPNTKGLTSFGNLRNCLPEPVSEAISEGMQYFDKKIKGFNREDTILCGIEARTSSPLRIERDQGFESNIKGIYPCGEGAGFAGGITSAAMDGIKVAQALVTV